MVKQLNTSSLEAICRKNITRIFSRKLLHSLEGVVDPDIYLYKRQNLLSELEILPDVFFDSIAQDLISNLSHIDNSCRDPRIVHILSVFHNDISSLNLSTTAIQALVNHQHSLYPDCLLMSSLQRLTVKLVVDQRLMLRFMEIAKFENLESFYTSAFSDASVFLLINKTPDIKCIEFGAYSLDNSIKLTTFGLSLLMRFLKLQRIIIPENIQIDSKTVAALLTCLPDLETFRCNPKVMTEALIVIHESLSHTNATFCQTSIHVNTGIVDYCTKKNVDAISFLYKMFPKLQELSLSAYEHSPNISEVDVDYLFAFRLLKKLSVKGVLWMNETKLRPMSLITHLRLEDVSISQGVRDTNIAECIIQSGGRLVHFHLHISQKSADHNQHEARFASLPKRGSSLSKMKSLSFAGKVSQQLIFKVLCVSPNVEKLALIGRHGTLLTEGFFCRLFIDHLLPKVKLFCLEEAASDMQQALNVSLLCLAVTNCPSLEELRVGNCYNDEQIEEFKQIMLEKDWKITLSQAVNTDDIT